ncbi:peroxiredoxin family protein [Arcticibacter sp. MXS-1]|uniref:peroxiredoxin family protein n=1 Tax=Arcticibacter sp. MXS-1 TaxID=3341726 RepID=UPI0035A973E9
MLSLISTQHLRSFQGLSFQTTNFDSPQPASPLKEGDFAPEFSFSPSEWVGIRPGRDISLAELHEQPLLILFYSTKWGTAGTALLHSFERLQSRLAGVANVIILSAEPAKELYKAVGNLALSLNFYYDKDQQLAASFGVFSEERPAWKLFSGLDENTPLLSAYAIRPNGQISYSSIEGLRGEFEEEDALTAVAGKAAIAS